MLPCAGLQKTPTWVRGAVYRKGDAVVVDSDASRVEELSFQHGGWAPEMEPYCAKEGVAVNIRFNGDVKVEFPDRQAWTYHPAAIQQVHRPGDLVRVAPDALHVKELAECHRECSWNPRMAAYCNQEGTVSRRWPRGDITVSFSDGQSWRYHPEALEKVRRRVEEPMEVGDAVRVAWDPEHVARTAGPAGEGAWNPRMTEYCGKKGLVSRVWHGGDVTVQFSDGQAWRYRSAVIEPLGKRTRRANAITEGTCVAILNDAACIEELAGKRGEGAWNTRMAAYCGQEGVVKRTWPDRGDVTVQFSNGQTWRYPLAAIEGITQDSIPTTEGDVVRVTPDAQRAEQLAGHCGEGAWNVRMAAYCGQQGTVSRCWPQGDMTVKFSDGESWRFHVAALEKGKRGSRAVVEEDALWANC